MENPPTAPLKSASPFATSSSTLVQNARPLVGLVGLKEDACICTLRKERSSRDGV